MSAVLYRYTCASCWSKFEASGVPEMSYGEFIIRSESGEEAYVEAVTNVAFDEVSHLVKTHPSLVGGDQNAVGSMIQKVFGVACDPSPSGQCFHIGMMPKCPTCLSHQMASWEGVFPPERSPIPVATQNRWALMVASEKAAAIDWAIKACET